MEAHAEVDTDAWDQRLLCVPSGNVFQSSAYGELCRAALHERPWYARVELDGRVLGQLLWFDSYWLRDRASEWGPLAAGVWRRLAPARRWHYGPVIFDTAVAASTTRLLLNAAAARGDVSLGVPAVYGLPDGSAVDAIDPREWAFQSQREGTLLLDLTSPLDTLWRRLSPDAKRNVRRASREGITVHEVHDEPGLGQFYEVYAQNGRRCGIAPKPFHVVADTHRVLADRHHVFLSVLDGVAVSAQAAIVWNGIVSLTGCSVSDVAFQKGLHGNDLMQWHVIQWSKSIGARLLDWVGYRLKPSPRHAGINRFKAKWGGTLFTYNTYSRINPALHVPLRWYRGYAGQQIAAD